MVIEREALIQEVRLESLDLVRNGGWDSNGSGERLTAEAVVCNLILEEIWESRFVEFL